MTPRFLLSVGFALIASSAQADLCSSLQQQYLSAGGGGGYSSAGRSGDVATLSRSLQAAQAAAQANRCNAGFFAGLFGNAPSPSCGAINQQIASLEDQIRQAYAGGGPRLGTIMTFASVSPQDQIRDALVANGCPVPGSYGGAGGYRTICVRSCDGYYFPISYGVSSNSFQADAQTCQAMYGGPNSAQLFAMPSDGDVAGATPVGGGKPYGSQPYAFLYRQAFNPACTAELQQGVASMSIKWATPATVAAATATPAPAMLVPRPVLRPPRFEDPETLANLAGGLVPQAMSAAVASAASGTRNGIRVVGAAYFNVMLDEQHAAGTDPGALPTTVH